MRRRSWSGIVEDALARLRHGYGAGVLSTATLEARVGQVFAAHSLGQLEAAIWDLPEQEAPWWSTLAGRFGWTLDEPPIALTVEGGAATELALVRASGVGRWTVGRSSRCDLRIADETVSRVHAEIGVRGDRCVIRDLGSCNGTYLNGRLIDRAQLHRRDTLRLGETLLRAR